MYGQSQYSVHKYAAEDISGRGQEEYYINLTRLVPEFIWRKIEMYEIYKTQGYEAGYLQHCMEDMMDQCFLTTATWGLSRWEQVLAIETNLSLTYEQRREILLAQIRGHGIATKEMIKETAAVFSGGDTDIIEDNPNSLFIVRFIGIKGIPRNMKAFINMLEEIKPAHLVYRFEYRYTVWEELLPYTWGDLSDMTWDNLRILKEA